jgi:hypothetical protein
MLHDVAVLMSSDLKPRSIHSQSGTAAEQPDVIVL